jgi:hypothetical protein
VYIRLTHSLFVIKFQMLKGKHSSVKQVGQKKSRKETKLGKETMDKTTEMDLSTKA